MNVRYWVLASLAVVVAITYFSGPRIEVPTYAAGLPPVPTAPDELANFTQQREAKQPTRAGNAAEIRWYDGRREKTEYSIVYLHGFGGSHRDGYPVNAAVADSLAANLYLGRWGDHGLLAAHALENFTPESAWADAKEALAIGNAIGEKTIIMSTSTGGTLAMMLAAEYPERVHALVNISPNVKDDMPGSWLLNSPWGHEIAALVGLGDGSKEISHEEPEASQYFDTIYPVRALVDLQVLVSTTMQETTFRKVRCPVQTLYYYKDAFTEDERVEVDVYPAVHAQFATPAAQQVLRALPTPGTHFMGCSIKSKDTEVVEREVLGFLRGVNGS